MINLSNLRQLIWLNRRTLLALTTTKSNKSATDTIIQLNLLYKDSANQQQIQEWEVEDIFDTISPKKVLRLFHNPEGDAHVYAEFADGQVMQYKLGINFYLPFIIY